MGKIFVISDTHFGHTNILKFEHDNKPLRPFSSLEEMHSIIIERWNSVVMPGDKVYHLGDVAFRKESMYILHGLNGKKRLIRGNHDLFKTSFYLDFFKEVYGVRQINGAWLTHVPMHQGAVNQDRVKVNIHGHIHANIIDHPKYFNVSVENIDYTPVALEDILQRIKK